MAKATAPLFSLEASGAFAKTLVFDRRGYVRQYVIPTNPKTANQADIRTPFAGVAAVIKNISDTAKADFKAKLEEQGRPTYRWNAELIGMVLENDGWSQREAAFNTYENTQKASWNSTAQAHGVNPQPVEYGTPPENFAGLSVFVVARVFHELGLGTGELPAGENAADWCNYLLKPAQ